MTKTNLNGVFLKAFFPAVVAAMSGCMVEEEGSDGPVEFHAPGEMASLDFSQGTEQYLLAAYTSSEAGDAISFTVDLATSAASEEAAMTLANTRSTRALPTHIVSPRLQNRLAFEVWRREKVIAPALEYLKRVTREQARLARAAGRLEQAQTVACDECAENEVCQDGTCESSPMLNVPIPLSDPPETEETSFTVARKGSSAAILVQSNLTVDDATLDDMLETFETLIFPRSAQLFGTPTLIPDGQQLAYDRNNDTLVWLVVTDVPFSGGDGEGSVGFFSQNDFTEDAGSNQADILYIIPPDDATPLNRIYPILAHEFQHLLGFAAKSYRPEANGEEGAREALWLDEGLSHFAEDACGFGGENVTLLNQELSNLDQINMFSEEDTLGMRTAALTYVRYIFEQKGAVTYQEDGSVTDSGGAAWLADIHTVAGVGTDGVSETVPTTFTDYRDAFDAWVATIALDGRNVTDDERYNYLPLIDDPAGDRTVGLTIRGMMKDFENEDVELTGPVEYSLTESAEDIIPAGSVKYFTLEGFEGSLDVTVSSEDPGFRYAVIQLQ